MSKTQACGWFSSTRIGHAVGTTYTRPVQVPNKIFEPTSAKHLKDISECSTEKESVFNTDEVNSAVEKSHLSGCFSHYQSFLTGLKIDRCLGTKHTALIHAIFENDEKLVSRLLKSGANPNGCSESSLCYTPVEVAVSMGNLGIVRLLCQAGSELNSKRSNVLQRAAQRGDAEMVTLLLDHGAQVDHVPSQQALGWLRPSSTALHEACSSFSRAVIQVLILRGADIEHEDWAGKTVLERALEMGADASDIVLTLRNNLVSKVIRRCDW